MSFSQNGWMDLYSHFSSSWWPLKALYSTVLHSPSHTTHSYSASISSTFSCSMRHNSGFSILLKDTSACRFFGKTRDWTVDLEDGGRPLYPLSHSPPNTTALVVTGQKPRLWWHFTVISCFCCVRLSAASRMNFKLSLTGWKWRVNSCSQNTVELRFYQPTRGVHKLLTKQETHTQVIVQDVVVLPQ